MSLETSPVDTRALRSALGAFATGVAVVTTVDEDALPKGCTINSFSSLSLEPPLVLWSLSLRARSFPAFSDAGRFLVNILAADQQAIAQRFASDASDKFAGVSWFGGIGGLPIIEDCAAYLECVKHSTYPGGDHAIFVGEIRGFSASNRAPLVFVRGEYFGPRPATLGVATAT